MTRPVDSLLIETRDASLAVRVDRVWREYVDGLIETHDARESLRVLGHLARSQNDVDAMRSVRCALETLRGAA